ncbi:MAG: cytochrome b/b6 domain-containing protein [Salinisphaera sp.]|nr:cytochrome b/b6 domain-containing protein [Salinisphaera sp.]
MILVAMLGSGLQIFNAHSALYWGADWNPADPLLDVYAVRTDGGQLKGITRILGYEFNTTGWLGASMVNGQMVQRAFPAWATIPSVRWLAMGRKWHFFFAWLFVINGLAYGLYALFSRHLFRDLIPSGRDLRGIGATAWEHLLFRFPDKDGTSRYNVLQKISYLVVMFGLLPLAVLTGMAMSPWLDTTFTWLVTLFDGRQSARTIHFMVAFLLVAFVLIHIFMVLVSGAWNNLRSMITGRYVLARSGQAHDPQD